MKITGIVDKIKVTSRKGFEKVEIRLVEGRNTYWVDFRKHLKGFGKALKEGDTIEVEGFSNANESKDGNTYNNKVAEKAKRI